MKSCNTCKMIRALKAKKERLITESVTGRIVTRSEFVSSEKFYFCFECGRAIRHDAIKHKKEILESLSKNCVSCAKASERRKRENNG